MTPGVCTAAAVELCVKGMDQYDGIAEEFPAWREWGAVGIPSRSAGPRNSVAALEDALVELEVCPG